MITAFRFILSIVICVFAAFFLKDYFVSIFSPDVKSVVIDAFFSMWAMFSLFFIGLLALGMTIFSEKNWRASKFNKVYILSGLISCLIISPILSTIVWYQLHEKAEGFIECEDLRRSARRYSSKTYADSIQECQRLVSKRDAREL